MKILILFFIFNFFLIQNSYSKDVSIDSKTLNKLNELNIKGSFSLNWKLVGPQEPGYEAQIQNQVFLSDAYLSINKKITNRFPFVLELNIPTATQGKVILYRFATNIIDGDYLKLRIGKFMIPFGRYNELYKGEDFLSSTRPLLYASPDSLDLVLRLNSPRPPFTAGYTDVGARVSLYPGTDYYWVPTEISAYIVNGFSEVDNRSRSFPYTGNLNVAPVPISGVNMDYGHVNNNLADNNNHKAPGGRIIFALGDLKVPFPISEGIELTGTRLGLSGMYGRYDLEEAIIGTEYKIWGVDTEFHYKNISFNIEYIYSNSEFRHTRVNSIGNVNFNQQTDDLLIKSEINKGYYIQIAFPIWKNSKKFKKILGFLSLESLERKGPRLVFSKNNDPITRLPIVAFPLVDEALSTNYRKYTAGTNFQITDHLIFKAEYSYWDINVPEVFNSHQTDINQTIVSWVFNF